MHDKKSILPFMINVLQCQYITAGNGVDRQSLNKNIGVLSGRLEPEEHTFRSTEPPSSFLRETCSLSCDGRQVSL